MELILPDYVTHCLEQIENNGYEAWCVGGAVRDLIMGKTPFDYDVTTNASPENIVSIFPKTVPTGIKHGTVTVVSDSGNIEVTTYRSDGKYIDHRTPDNVKFLKNIDDDLKRRDFTVNAICYNHKYDIYDPLNGIEDIKNKTIRAIGNPNIRFTEDALRIMRAFRFSTQLGFTIEQSSLKSAIKLSYLLENISVERIYSEFKKILTSANPENLSPLLNHGTFEFLGIQKSEIPSVFKLLYDEFSLRFSVFCYLNNLDGVNILKSMKSDNLTVNSVKIYLEILNMPIPKTKADIKQLLSISGIESFIGLLNYYQVTDHEITQLKRYFDEIIQNNEPYSIKMLAVTGEDLTKLGFKGKEIGNTLEYLKNQVIEESYLNTKEQLLKLINK